MKHTTFDSMVDRFLGTCRPPASWSTLMLDELFDNGCQVTDVTGSEVILEFDMPGFKQKDVRVEVEKDVLRISAENKNRKFHSCKLLNERTYDLSKADAELADGVLTVKIPKRERNESSVRQIDVKARGTPQ